VGHGFYWLYAPAFCPTHYPDGTRKDGWGEKGPFQGISGGDTDRTAAGQGLAQKDPSQACFRAGLTSENPLYLTP